MYSELRNKEFGTIDLLKLGWKIFQKKFFSILIITLLVDLPVRIFEDALLAAGVPGLATQIPQSAALLWTKIAVMLIVEKEIIGDKIQVSAALKKSSYRYPSAILSTFLLGILLGVRLLPPILFIFLLRIIYPPLRFMPFRFLFFNPGFMLFGSIVFFLLVIDGIRFFVNIVFFIEAIGLRNQGAKAARDYSRNIVKGSFWKVLYTYLVVFIIVFIFPMFIFSFLMEAVSVWAGQEASSELLINVIVLLFSTLANYLGVVTLTVFFLNMDYRKSLENE